MTASRVANWLDLMLSQGATVEPLMTQNGQNPRDAAWVCLPFDSRAASFIITMASASVLGDEVDATDVGIASGANPVTITDPNGYPIQDPATGLVTSPSYVMSANGATWAWRLIQDSYNGIFWSAIHLNANGFSSSGGIGGGPAGASQSGTITLPANGNACIGVDLTSGDATVDVSTIAVAGTWPDGLAFQFDPVMTYTQGVGTTYGINFQGGRFLADGNGGQGQPTLIVDGVGHSTTIKYNKAKNVWTVTS